MLRDTAIITVNWRRYDLTLYLLDCIAAFLPSPGGVFIVDNEAREDAATEILARHPVLPNVELSRSNLGYAAAVNRAIYSARKRGLVRFILLNNDISFDSDFASPLLQLTTDPRVAFAAPCTLSPSGALETCGVRLDASSPYVVQHFEQAPDEAAAMGVDAVQGSVMAFTASTLDRVGLLDEAYFYGWEETDWCLRATRIGQLNVVTPLATVTHEGSASLGGPTGYNPVIEFMLLRNMLHFLRKFRFGGHCVESHLSFWTENAERTSIRAPGTPPADPVLARAVVERAIQDFHHDRWGPWPNDLESWGTQ